MKKQSFGGFGSKVGGSLGSRLGSVLGKRLGSIFGKKAANEYLPGLTWKLGLSLLPGLFPMLPFFNKTNALKQLKQLK